MTYTYIPTGANAPKEGAVIGVVPTILVPQPTSYVGFTLLDLIKQVLTQCDLSWQSTEGELMEGDFSPPEVPRQTTHDFITSRLNEGFNHLCRGGGFFLMRQGQQSIPTGRRDLHYTALSTLDGAVLWGAEEVTWTPDGGNEVRLQFIGREYALPYYRTTTPVQYWSLLDTPGISLLGVPQSQGLVKVTGRAIPPPLSGYDDFAAWATPDVTDAAVSYACSELCEKKAALAPRKANFDAEWMAWRQRLTAQAMASNPSLAAFHGLMPGGNA